MKKLLPALLALSTLFAFQASPLLAADILPVPPQASKRVATVQVRVAPDHPDWTYKPGEKVQFRIFVTADNIPLSVPVSYSVGKELMPAATIQASVGPEGLLVDGGTLNEPGFIRCKVETEVAAHTYRGAAAAAFSPEKIAATQTDPADFDVFWEQGRAELAKIPMDARMTLMPEACTSKINVYHVSFRSTGDSWQSPARIYGILCEPKTPGKYPAVLRVPGAGVRPYFGDKDIAERGAITLEIGIHGIPLNLPKEVYDVLLPGALNEYWTFNADDRQKFYYHRVVLGCLRSNDFIATLPNWDGKNLVVAGASQGGFLAIATAALDKRVTGLSATHPAMCDLTGPLFGRAGGWPHPFRNVKEGKLSAAEQSKCEALRYYDSVNFARRVRVPGFYIWGYNDEVCPPTSCHAAFNTIQAPKELALTLEHAHSYTQEQYDVITSWIANFLKLPQ